MKVKRCAASLLAAALSLALLLPAALADEVVVSGGGEVALNGTVGEGGCTVTVTVQDSGARPLSGATVAVRDFDVSAVTGADGIVQITGLVRGLPYPLQVSKPGYVSAEAEYLCEEREGTLTVTHQVQPPDDSGSGGGTIGGGGGGSVIGPTEPVPSEPVPSKPAPPEPIPTPAETQPPAPTPAVTARPSDPVRPVRPSPSDTPDISVPPEVQEPEPEKPAGAPIYVAAEEGEVLIPIPELNIRQSVEENAPIVVAVTTPEGTVEYKMPAFTEHDQALTGQTEVWVDVSTDTPELILRVSPETQKAEDGAPPSQVAASIPHNLVESVREWAGRVRVIFEEPDLGGETEYILPREFFAHATYEDLDFSMERDCATGEAALLYSLTSFHAHTGRTVVPADAFTYAAQQGCALKTRIYNPADEGDLWYEWNFAAADLADLVAGDVDLYTRPGLAVGDPLRGAFWWRRTQGFTVSHHGPLPATATLRVRNMADFPVDSGVDAVTLSGSGAQEILGEDLPVDGMGFITCPGLTHCSGYLLVGAVWWWLILAAGLAILLAAGTAMLVWRRKKMHGKEPAHEQRDEAGYASADRGPGKKE